VKIYLRFRYWTNIFCLSEKIVSLLDKMQQANEFCRNQRKGTFSAPGRIKNR
jgi:hypothetical protein